MTQEILDPITDDPPPATEYHGPADPEDRILAEPDRKPYTVVVFSLDAVHLRGSARTGTAVVHVTATDPNEAGLTAIQVINGSVNTKLWSHAVPLFVTEGYHLDVRPELLSQQTGAG